MGNGNRETQMLPVLHVGTPLSTWDTRKVLRRVGGLTEGPHRTGLRQH